MVSTRTWTTGLLLVAALAHLGQAAPAPASDPASAVATASVAFTCEVLDRMADGDGNLVWSPFGASTVLALTLGGARGRTASQLAQALALPANALHVDEGYQELIRVTREAGHDALSLAAGVWVQRGRALVPAFVERCATRYGGAAREVDFAAASEAARRTINAWVREQTAGHIEELLRSDGLAPRTQLVLTSAVHLAQRWQRPFDASRTTNGRFNRERGPAVSATMMRVDGAFGLYEGRALRAVELPYRGRRLSMWIVMPQGTDGLAPLQRAFSARAFGAMLDGARECEVAVTLPRFSCQSEHRLARALQAMGARDLFSDSADLTGIAPGPLKVDDVIQAARVRVDEVGTEAAAATAVTVIEKSAGPIRPFVVDRPFLFFIVEKSRRVVLFAGRIKEPR